MKKIVIMLLLTAFLSMVSSCASDKGGINKPNTQADNNLRDPLNTTDTDNSLEQLFEVDKSNESNSDKMELSNQPEKKSQIC